MNISNELTPLLESEDQWITKIKADLAVFGDSITEKAEHHLRMGFRTKALIDIKLNRYRTIH